MTWRHSLHAVLAAALAMGADGPARQGPCPASPRPLTVLTAEAPSASQVRLKLVLFSPGRDFQADASMRLELRRPGAEAVAVPFTLNCRRWSRRHVEILPFGPFDLSDKPFPPLHVHAGPAGEPLARLGALEAAGQGSGEIVFRRAGPWPSGPVDGRRVQAFMACERVGNRRFVLKAAYFNCGERFDTDLSAFVHFEFEPLGESLEAPCALGLTPRSQLTDTSVWSESETTVVCLGVVEVPRKAPASVYVRAGLYDQFGSGQRVDLAGSDDGTGRVLVGRFVNTRDRVTFERRVAPQTPTRPDAEARQP